MSDARYRTQVGPTFTGRFSWDGGASWQNEGTRTGGFTECLDFLGKLSDHPFVLDRVSEEGGTLSGVISNSGYPWRIFDRMPFSFSHMLPRKDFLESETDSYLRAYNISNPGRPEVLLPVFLAELRDVPKMVRQFGDTLRYIRNGTKRPLNTISGSLSYAKKVAADNLAYQFGWEALFSDLKKMVLFTDAIKKRSKELDRLHSGRGLKRRITLDDRSETTRGTGATFLGNSTQSFAYQLKEVVTTSSVRRWGTMRYKPNSNSPLPKDDDRIRQMLTGITPSALASNVWEGIPWSWLADYFTNLGDIVDSTNNSADVSLVSACIMSYTRQHTFAGGEIFPFNIGGQIVGDVVFSPYTRLSETKVRRVDFPSFPTPSIGLPLLGGRQLSILGSLAVMRTGKR